jgi:tight adherence protein B
MSAWILGLLPFGVAGVINIVNPGYMAILFTDPAGIKWVIAALIMMVIGVFFMWRIIDIHV